MAQRDQAPKRNLDLAADVCEQFALGFPGGVDDFLDAPVEGAAGSHHAAARGTLKRRVKFRNFFPAPDRGFTRPGKSGYVRQRFACSQQHDCMSLTGNELCRHDNAPSAL